MANERDRPESEADKAEGKNTTFKAQLGFAMARGPVSDSCHSRTEVWLNRVCQAFGARFSRDSTSSIGSDFHDPINGV